MAADKSLYELSSDEYLKGRIEFLKNKMREFKLEIKRTEDLLRAYEEGRIADIQEQTNQLRIPEISAELDFSVTVWKKIVYDFLFENPTSHTTDQILIGTDGNKDYQRIPSSRSRAIKAISSSLFQLHKEGKITKEENTGRRGFKWSYKEPAPPKGGAG